MKWYAIYEGGKPEFTEGKVYTVDMGLKMFQEGSRLGVVVDDEGDTRTFFAEEFRVLTPVPEVSANPPSKAYKPTHGGYPG